MDESNAIAVVGGGPAGLAAALTLAQRGREVRLIAPTPPGVDRRTSALFGPSIELLEALGVWGTLRDHCAPLRVLRILDGTRRLIRAPETTFRASEIGREAFGYNVPNALLTAALRERLDDASVAVTEALVEDVRFADDHVTLTDSDGGVHRAPLVVAADGRRSSLREAAGIRTRTWRYDQAALVCDLHHAHGHQDTSNEFHTEHGPFTLVPLPGKRSSLVWIDRPAATRRRAELAPNELATEIETRSAHIYGAMTVDGPVQTFQMGGLEVSQIAARRIALVGEAAHVFPPIGAQGLNLGYRDVADLAATIGDSADPGSADVLTRYNRARLGDMRSRTLAVDVLNRTLLSDLLPAQALRGVGLFALGRIPALRQAAMRAGVASATPG